MPIAPPTPAAQYATAIGNLTDTSLALDFAKAFADMYETRALLAVGTTVIISAAGKAALLTALTGITASNKLNATTLGNALATFWSVELTPFPPNTVVINDAAAMGTLFASAITSSIKDCMKKKSIDPLLTATDKIVKTIKYTGTAPGPVVLIAPLTL